MSTFIWTPSYGSPVGKKPRVKLATFGDGYAQRIGDGINPTPRIWDVTFQVTIAVADAIDAFLATQNGVASFDWTPPRGVIGKFVCSEWKRNPVDFSTDNITGSFVEVFGE